MAHAGGRPTDYIPEYCEQVEEFMSTGLSQEAFAGNIGVSEDTIYEWKKVHKEFSEAVKRGVSKSRKFWEELGLVGTTEGNHFNAPTWIFNMKNRFKWKDRHDITTDDEKLDGLVVVKNGSTSLPLAE